VLLSKSECLRVTGGLSLTGFSSSSLLHHTRFYTTFVLFSGPYGYYYLHAPALVVWAVHASCKAKQTTKQISYVLMARNHEANDDGGFSDGVASD